MKPRKKSRKKFSKKSLNSDPLFDTDQAGGYVHRHPRTLTNDRCKGTGPRFIRMGRLIRYRKSDLDAYIESSLVGGE